MKEDDPKSIKRFFQIAGALLLVSIWTVIVAFFLVQNVAFNEESAVDNLQKIAQNE